MLTQIRIGRGLNVFQAFTSYLKSKKADDPTKEELLKELAALDQHLRTKVHIKYEFSYFVHEFIGENLEMVKHVGIPGL